MDQQLLLTIHFLIISHVFFFQSCSSAYKILLKSAKVLRKIAQQNIYIVFYISACHSFHFSWLQVFQCCEALEPATAAPWGSIEVGPHSQDRFSLCLTHINFPKIEEKKTPLNIPEVIWSVLWMTQSAQYAILCKVFLYWKITFWAITLNSSEV